VGGSSPLKAGCSQALTDSEALRAALENSADLDKTQSTTSGWSLFLAQNGGMPNMKAAAELWKKTDEAVKKEFNDKAKLVRADDDRSRAAEARPSVPLRRAALGADAAGR